MGWIRRRVYFEAMFFDSFLDVVRVMKIKQGDLVIVITGKYAGKTPRKVLQVLQEGSKVLLQGVNEVFKHVKKGHPKSPSGGRLKMEMPIQSSNVAFYCESCSRGVRLGMRYTAEGAKERFCRKCKTSVGVVSPPRPKYAQK